MTSLLPDSRRPDVTFRKDGRIDITARIAKMLHLQHGDVIDIATENDEFLLYVRLRGDQTIGRHEAQCRQTKQHSFNFRCYSKRLAQAIIRIVGKPSIGFAGVRLPAGSPVIFGPNGTAIPLITRNPL